MAKDYVKIIGGFMMPCIYCFPKRHYPTKESAIEKWKNDYKDGSEVIDTITEHQVGCFHILEETSYEYDEWEEYYDYRYADEYRPNKKYSERFAPSCWCIETDFSPEHIKLIDECFCNIKQD